MLQSVHALSIRRSLKVVAAERGEIPSMEELRGRLRSAVSSGQLRKIGRSVRLNDDGTVPSLIRRHLNNSGHFSQQISTEPWLSIINSTVAEVKELLGTSLVSISLRGSLASGYAQVGVSDADFIVVYKEGDYYGIGENDDGNNVKRVTPKSFTAQNLRSAAAALTLKHSATVTKVELAAIPIRDPKALRAIDSLLYSATPSDSLASIQLSANETKDILQLQKGIFSGMSDLDRAFMLKTSAVNVWGLDMASALPDAAARPPPLELGEVRADVMEALYASRSILKRNSSDIHAAERPIRWALKRCLRAAAARFCPGSYARDLAVCASLASRSLSRNSGDDDDGDDDDGVVCGRKGQGEAERDSQLRNRQLIQALLLATSPSPVPPSLETSILLQSHTTSLLFSLSSWISTSSSDKATSKSPITKTSDDQCSTSDPPLFVPSFMKRIVTIMTGQKMQ